MSQPTRADQHLPETHSVDRESSGIQERGDTNSSEVVNEPARQTRKKYKKYNHPAIWNHDTPISASLLNKSPVPSGSLINAYSDGTPNGEILYFMQGFPALDYTKRECMDFVRRLREDYWDGIGQVGDNVKAYVLSLLTTLQNKLDLVVKATIAFFYDLEATDQRVINFYAALHIKSMTDVGAALQFDGPRPAFPRYPNELASYQYTFLDNASLWMYHKIIGNTKGVDLDIQTTLKFRALLWQYEIYTGWERWMTMKMDGFKFPHGPLPCSRRNKRARVPQYLKRKMPAMPPRIQAPPRPVYTLPLRPQEPIINDHYPNGVPNPFSFYDERYIVSGPDESRDIVRQRALGEYRVDNSQPSPWTRLMEADLRHRAYTMWLDAPRDAKPSWLEIDEFLCDLRVEALAEVGITAEREQVDAWRRFSTARY